MSAGKICTQEIFCGHRLYQTSGNIGPSKADLCSVQLT